MTIDKYKIGVHSERQMMNCASCKVQILTRAIINMKRKDGGYVLGFIVLVGNYNGD